MSLLRKLLKEERIKRASKKWRDAKTHKFPTWFQGYEDETTPNFIQKVFFEAPMLAGSDYLEKVVNYILANKVEMHALALDGAGTMEEAGGNYDEQVEFAAMLIVSVVKSKATE